MAKEAKPSKIAGAFNGCEKCIDTEEIEIELTVKISAFRGEFHYAGVSDLEDPVMLAKLAEKIAYHGTRNALNRPWAQAIEINANRLVREMQSGISDASPAL